MPPDTRLREGDAGTRESSRPRRRHRVLRAALVLVLVLGLGAGGLWLAEYSLYRQVGTVDADLSALRGRPAEAADDAVDVAVIWTAGGRWVSQMLLRIDADRRSASFVSVPDSRVEVLAQWHRSMPAQPSGRDVAQIAARIEEATGHRLDHLAILDWQAVARLTNRLGGIDAYFGPEGADARWAEHQPVTGDLIAPLVDRDDCLTGGAATTAERKRIRRQQVLLHTVLDQTLHQELVYNPIALYRDLDAVAENLVIDSGWSQRELVDAVVSLRHLRSHAITFETAPGIQAPRGAPGADC